MIWDFSKEDTWRAMRYRANEDARAAVLSFWPHEVDEASPDMPQDLDRWARALTLDFLKESMGLPKWAREYPAVGEGVYLTVRNAYYDICRPQIEWWVCRRIMDTHKLPRATMPPASPRRAITYPLNSTSAEDSQPGQRQGGAR